MASIITPNGQIQQVQLASVAQQQNIMSQVAAQVGVNLIINHYFKYQ